VRSIAVGASTRLGMPATSVVGSTGCLGRVAEWQTRWLQVPVSFGTWGFKSPFAHSKAMLTIMAAFAQLERDTMIERTRAGLVAAAANGRKGGRPRKVDDADAAKARQLRDKGIAKMLGVSRATVYRCLTDDAA
jgi:Resolvase, N terminal domain/Helix-turn-helix domain of resolvase